MIRIFTPSACLLTVPYLFQLLLAVVEENNQGLLLCLAVSAHVEMSVKQEMRIKTRLNVGRTE